MTQHFIIDGYNLMKNDHELAMFLQKGLEYAREAVIKRVSFATGLKNATTIVIVFDGNKNGQATQTQQKQGRIDIIYSKLGETADDVIKRLLKNHTTPDEVKIITRDWELKDAAQAGQQTSGNITRRPPSINKVRQALKDDADSAGWNNSTKKKGTAKRASKKDRKKGPSTSNDVYW